MNIPPYWAKGSYTGRTKGGKEITIDAFGWSSESIDDAKRHGMERAKKVVETGIGSGRKGDYEYGDKPFREEVTGSLDVDGRKIALISRCRYGSLVLNSANVMFVDIDFPEYVSTGFWDSILLSFSEKRRRERKRIMDEITLDDILRWHDQNSGKSFRLYRTHSGFRMLLTDKTYEPKSDESKKILAELNADRLYCSLTERQECYRARLTPKPWRCNGSKPPCTYPWEKQEEEKQYRIWETNYQKLAEGFSTCLLHKEFGMPSQNAEIQAVIRYHDLISIQGVKPLA